MTDQERIQYIDEKMDELVAAVGRIEGSMKSLQCATHSDKLILLDRHIRGNGNAGINTRLDRLERVSKIKERILWAMAGTTLSAVAAVIVSIMIG